MLTLCKSVDGINPGHLEHFKNTLNTSEIEIATGEVAKDTMGAKTEKWKRASLGKIYIWKDNLKKNTAVFTFREIVPVWERESGTTGWYHPEGMVPDWRHWVVLFLK